MWYLETIWVLLARGVLEKVCIFENQRDKAYSR